MLILIFASVSFHPNRNLVALSFIRIAKWMNLVMPVVVLFYHSNGLSLREIFLLQSIYSVTIMLLEIPTGYFADVMGRRTSILGGSVLGFSGFLVYSFSHGFWGFALAETLLGVSLSLVSGADSALLYDSLRSEGKESRYTRYEGRLSSVGNFAEAAAGILGGLLATVSLRTPYFVQTVVALIAIPAALSLTEPPLHTMAPKPSMKRIVNIVRNTLVHDRKLKWNTWYSAITGVTTLTMTWFAQPYFIQLGLPVALFGLVWAVLNLSAGAGSLLAWRVEERLGPAGTALVFSGMLCISFLVLGLVENYTGMVFLLVFYVARGIATPTLRTYVNRLALSEERATVMSVRNFLIRFIFAITGPFFGWLSDRYELSTAILASAGWFILLTIPGIFWFIRLESYKR